CRLSFFRDPATTEIYTLSLHDALPICVGLVFKVDFGKLGITGFGSGFFLGSIGTLGSDTSSTGFASVLCGCSSSVISFVLGAGFGLCTDFTTLVGFTGTSSSSSSHKRLEF